MVFFCSKNIFRGVVLINNRQYYKNSKVKFKKITVEIEEDLYKKLIYIRNDYFDSRSIKYIINKSLLKYFKESL